MYILGPKIFVMVLIVVVVVVVVLVVLVVIVVEVVLRVVGLVIVVSLGCLQFSALAEEYLIEILTKRLFPTVLHLCLPMGG